MVHFKAWARMRETTMHAMHSRNSSRSFGTTDIPTGCNCTLLQKKEGVEGYQYIFSNKKTLHKYVAYVNSAFRTLYDESTSRSTHAIGKASRAS